MGTNGYPESSGLEPAFPGVHDSSGRPDGQDYICVTLGDSETCKANARLIAAAPELLDIMENIAMETKCYENGARPYSGDSYLPEHFRAGIRAIIAKAKGTP